MKINKQNVFYPKSRKDWRNWLLNNFDKEQEVWLLFPKKHTNKERLNYNDAVEEALCFGWIDGILKSLDDDLAQRFTPRNPKTSFSQSNKERLALLTKQGLIHSSVKPIVAKILKEKFIFPEDILERIKKDKDAWKNYQKFSPGYKRIRIAYINDARKLPEEFKKRLENFISKTKENKQIGVDWIKKYF